MNQQALGRNNADAVGKKLLVLAQLFASSPSKKWATWLRSPLDNAARDGDFELVNAILFAGADARSASSLDAGYAEVVPNSDRNRSNLVASAAFGGSPRVVSALVAAGSRSDINMADASTGNHPLHIAAGRGHRKVVQLLVRLGADVNAQVAGCPGNTGPRGSKRNVDGSYRPSSSSLRRGMTPLHFAAIQGHWEIMVDLIMHGADTESKITASQESPMHLAARRGHHTAVSALLAAGASPKVLSRRNLFPMDLAACHRHSSTVREFLDYGIDPNTKNPLGYTALHQAAYHNAGDTLDTLVDAGGNLNAVTNNGHTPLHAAALSSSSSASRQKNSDDARAVRTIGQYTAVNIDATDTAGATPLHTACVHLRERAVEELLGMGADATLIRFSSCDKAAMEARTSNSSYGPGGVTRVLAMLTTARADTTWRRRGWLVLLRARAALALAQQKHQIMGPPAGSAGLLENLIGKRAREGTISSGYRRKGNGGDGGEFPRGGRLAMGGRHLQVQHNNGRPSSCHRGRGLGGDTVCNVDGWGEVVSTGGITGGGGGVELPRGATIVERITLLQDVTVFRRILAFL